VPTRYWWTGVVSDDWVDRQNWKMLQGGAYVVADRYPGQDNHVEDAVELSGVTPSHCTLAVASTVQQVRISELNIVSFGDATNHRFLQVVKSSLYVSGRTVDETFVRGKFRLDGGGVEIVEGVVALEDTDGVWTDGVINNRQLQVPQERSSNAPGTLAVTKTSKLAIGAKGLVLGVTLEIGGSPGPALSYVTLGGMQGNLQLNYNVPIVVKSNGVLNLDQNANSASAGGITKNANSPNSVISNFGTIDRRERDQLDAPGAPVQMRIEPKVINEASTALFRMVKDSSIHFVGGFEQKGGKFQGDQSRIKAPPGTKFSMLGGAIQLQGTGQYVCQFDGDVEITGGSLFVGTNQTKDAAATDFCTMKVTEDLTLGADAHVYLAIDLEEKGNGDLIEVGGTVAVEGADLTITFTNNEMDVDQMLAFWEGLDGATWDLVTAAARSGSGGDDGWGDVFLNGSLLPSRQFDKDVAVYLEWDGGIYQLMFELYDPKGD
jgi:hypothetical protein